MNIAFTGHRNKTANTQELDNVASSYPGATWITGGAVGFDSQVAEYAASHAIDLVTMPPDYSKLGKIAPLARNRAMVDNAQLICALYDGRESGGTFYTINYANRTHKPLIILSPIQN